MTDEQIVEAMLLSKDPQLKILGEVMALQQRKNADYNSKVSRDEYWPFGLVSFVQMLWVKVLRLRSLVENGQAPKNESIEDTAKDLINYSVFLIDWIRRVSK